LYYNGKGVPQDYARAAIWFSKAAEHGDAAAQSRLAFAYLDGQGVPQNYAQAALLFRKAAEQGNAAAQGVLGVLYHEGLGVPQDYAEVYFWCDLAAAGEQDTSKAKDATKHRDEAASHLTPADLARVQAKVRQWLKAHQAKSQ
jgi:TPR repeat protein